MVSGLANAAEVLNQVRAGTCDLDWIELAAVPMAVSAEAAALTNSRSRRKTGPSLGQYR